MIYLLILLAALQAFDAITTRRVLDQGGREVNPFISRLINVLGFWPAMGFKGVVLVGACWAGGNVPVVVAICVLYAGIITWNWNQSRN